MADRRIRFPHEDTPAETREEAPALEESSPVQEAVPLETVTLQGLATVLDSELERQQTLYRIASEIRTTVSSRVLQLTAALQPLEHAVTEAQHKLDQLNADYLATEAAHQSRMQAMEAEFIQQQQVYQGQLDQMRQAVAQAEAVLGALGKPV